jgi:hypothetical protein
MSYGEDLDFEAAANAFPHHSCRLVLARSSEFLHRVPIFDVMGFSAGTGVKA